MNALHSDFLEGHIQSVVDHGHFDRQRMNFLHTLFNSVIFLGLVSVPDPKPTPARIAFSITCRDGLY